MDSNVSPQNFAVKADKISKIVKNGDKTLQILDQISFQLEFGKSLAIVGPSGSGKSTILHTLGLLTPVDAGQLWLRGEKVDYKNTILVNELRKNVSLIFEDAKLISDLDLLGNVCVPLMHKGIWPKRQRQIAMKAIEKVGLENRIDHMPSQLSGGERMRVAIARAVCSQPKILLADEPTGSLDSHTGEIIADLLFSTIGKDSCLVLVTHHQPLAERAQQIIKLVDGRIINGKLQ